jgi:hypothetical protein
MLLGSHESIRSVFVGTLRPYLLALPAGWPRQVTSSFLSSTHLAAAGATDADHGARCGNGICQQKAVAPDVGSWFCAWLEMTPTLADPAQNTMIFSRKISEMQIALLVSSEIGNPSSGSKKCTACNWTMLEGFQVSTQFWTAPVRIGTHSATLHRATTSLFLQSTRQCLNGGSYTDGSLRHLLPAARSRRSHQQRNCLELGRTITKRYPTSYALTTFWDMSISKAPLSGG